MILKHVIFDVIQMLPAVLLQRSTSYNSSNSIIQGLLLNLLIAKLHYSISLSILALLQEDMTDEGKIFRGLTASLVYNSFVYVFMQLQYIQLL